MSNPLGGVDIDRWPLVLLILSFATMLALVVAKEKELAGLALGVSLFAFGELINHPKQITIFPGAKVTSHQRQPRFIGLVFDAIGLGLLGLFAYRLAG